MDRLTVVNSTLTAASVYAVGQEAVAGVIAAKVHSLAEAMLQTALPTKLNILTALFAIIPLFGAAAAVSYHMRAAGQTQAAKTAEKSNRSLANEDKSQHKRDPFAAPETDKEFSKGILTRVSTT